MHKFGSVKECPKCGRSIFGACWDVEWKPEEITFFVIVPQGIVGSEVQPAYMIRNCRCGYSWREKPKDAE